MGILTHIPPILKNKYLIAGAAFVAWMFFFDPKDIPSQLEKRARLKELEKTDRQMTQLINETRTEDGLLKNNDISTLEKYAREKYHMKKDNEDLFIIPPPSESK
jgi:cell division protein FtsB